MYLFPKATPRTPSRKKEWWGAVLSIATADFAESSLRWYQHLKKEVAIGSGYIEKT
jgi:hypothetical protein